MHTTFIQEAVYVHWESGSHTVCEGGDLELIDLRTVVKYKLPQPSTDRETEEDIDLAAATKPLVSILYLTWHA